MQQYGSLPAPLQNIVLGYMYGDFESHRKNTQLMRKDFRSRYISRLLQRIRRRASYRWIVNALRGHEQL